VEKPPEVETMFTNIFLEMGRAIGAADAQPDDGYVPTAVASVPSPVLPDLKKELRGWGIGMIGIGVLSIIISEYLDPIWGGALIVIGILNLVIVHRAMFIVNGIILILAGIMNILSLSSSGFSYFFIFGFLQIWWGIQEIVKFRKYKFTSKSSEGEKM
jgi:hypothetical protein